MSDSLLDEPADITDLKLAKAGIMRNQLMTTHSEDLCNVIILGITWTLTQKALNLQ
jgi:cytochrome b involved in lipid metabolism